MDEPYCENFDIFYEVRPQKWGCHGTPGTLAYADPGIRCAGKFQVGVIASAPILIESVSATTKVFWQIMNYCCTYGINQKITEFEGKEE